MVSWSLSLKGLRVRWRRYAVMAGAITFCFAVVLLLSGLAAGMSSDLHANALPRYGGDLFILGQQQTPYGTPLITDNTALRAAIRASGIDAIRIAPRTAYYQSGLVFFNGYAVPQKVISGVDWKVEGGTFAGLDFVAGGYQEMAGSNGILLSTVTAQELQVRVGDNVLVEATTIRGEQNTEDLIVKGIFRDSSIFGAYTSYMDLSHLNRLIGLKPNECTILGIYLRHPGRAAADAPRLYAELAKRVPMFPPVETEREFWTELTKRWSGVQYEVLALRGYLSEVGDVTSAVDIGLAFLLLMMLVIIFVGISNTYSVIVHDRIREFGTMRAIGMQRGGVERLILSETLLLGLFGIGAGSAIGFAALAVVGSLPGPHVPGFEIFLLHGRLGWGISPLLFVVEAILIIAAVIAGGMIPARRASRLEPAAALRIVA